MTKSESEPRDREEAMRVYNVQLDAAEAYFRSRGFEKPAWVPLDGSAAGTSLGFYLVNAEFKLVIRQDSNPDLIVPLRSPHSSTLNQVADQLPALLLALEHSNRDRSLEIRAAAERIRVFLLCYLSADARLPQQPPGQSQP